MKRSVIGQMGRPWGLRDQGVGVRILRRWADKENGMLGE